MRISELVFGTLTQNRSSLEPSLGFAAIAGTPRIENGGTFAVADLRAPLAAAMSRSNVTVQVIPRGVSGLYDERGNLLNPREPVRASKTTSRRHSGARWCSEGGR